MGIRPTCGSVVELAQRFYKAKGWYGGIFSGIDCAYQIYDKAAEVGMSRQANGSVMSVAPGDMFILSGYTAGHIGIGDSMVGNGNGTKTLNIVNQNA